MSVSISNSILFLILVVSLLGRPACAQQRAFANVPPSLEIEVLDPGVDSLGNPAVISTDGKVDIPPTVLVHRYYYSGDRSFQGPMLPGGPSILVFDHPKTGERTYVQAQMMPGAPRVIYTKKGITYQYEKHAIMLCIGTLGTPKIKYRSGLSLKQRFDKVLHVEQTTERWETVKIKTKYNAQRLKTSLTGVTADLVEGGKAISLPIQHLVKAMPFGAQLMSGENEAYLAQRAAEFRRDIEIKQATRRAKLDDITIATNR